MSAGLAWHPVNVDQLKRAPWRVQVAHRVHALRDQKAAPQVFFKAGSGWLLHEQHGAWLAFNEKGWLVAVSPEGGVTFEPPGDRDWF